MSEEIKKGLLMGITRIFSFIIGFAITGILGFSIVEEPFFVTLFAVFGGFIGAWIFGAWWRAMKSSSIGAVLKAFIFTIFTIVLLLGIVFIGLEKI